MQSLPNFFVYGTQYYRPPTPTKREWREDISNIKRIGFNTVKVWLIWRWHERVHGKFKWDDMDELMGLLHEEGLKIVPNLLVDGAPSWLYKLYDCKRVDPRGNPIHAISCGALYVGGWMPCFDNPNVRREATKFVRAAVQRYKKHEILAWDVWNEPRSRAIDHEPAWSDCACKESKKRYREWLRRKFGSINKLNDLYGRTWSHWDDVDPPISTRDYAEIYLWRQWAMDSVADRVRWVADEVRALDKIHPVMSHVGCCSPYQDILTDSSDDWMNSQQVDYYGSSLPILGDNGLASFSDPNWQDNFYLISMIADWIRSLSSYFWISEIYPSKSTWLHKDLTVDDLIFWIWTLIAHGSKGLLYWQYKAERLGDESGGYGLVDLDGQQTSRSIEAQRLANIIAKNEEAFIQAKTPPAEVGVVYDTRSDLISRVESADLYIYKRNIQGIYKAFWDLNIALDWVPIHELERLKSYKMIYLPSQFIMDETLAGALKEYVKDGGFLVSDMGLGLRSENTWLNPLVPSHGLDEVFGCSELERTRVEGKELLLRMGDIEAIPGVISTTLEVRESVEKLGLWSDGRPGVVVNRFGNGQAVYIGTFLGFSNLVHGDQGSEKIIASLVARAGIRPQVQLESAHGLIKARVMNMDEERAMIFVFNYEDKNQELLMRKPLLQGPIELIGDSVVRADQECVSISIPPKRVACVVGDWAG